MTAASDQKPKTQQRGHCQCCGGEWAVPVKTGCMSKHGYQVKNGWQEDVVASALAAIPEVATILRCGQHAVGPVNRQERRTCSPSGPFWRMMSNDFYRGLPIFQRHLIAMARALWTGAVVIGWVLCLWLMVVDWTLPAGEHAGPFGMAGATVIWVLLSAVLV